MLGGVMMLNMQVETINMVTIFLVVPSKSSFNDLKEIYWIHIKGKYHWHSTTFWNEAYKVETVEEDDSPCYLQQLHLDFELYNP